MDKIFNEIKTEREYQIKKWGNSLDDKNTPYNWSAYISNYATKALTGDPDGLDIIAFRVSMIKVAALAVAALEALDRKAGN